MPRFPVGHHFPTQSIFLAPERIDQYLAVVESESPLYLGDERHTPPLAIAAWVLAGLVKAIELPPGSVHATQEFMFVDRATVGTTLRAEAEVIQSTVRAGMEVIVVEMRASHEGRPVLSGRSMLMMPLSEGMA